MDVKMKNVREGIEYHRATECLARVMTSERTAMMVSHFTIE
jgi:hypothetical protein